MKSKSGVQFLNTIFKNPDIYIKRVKPHSLSWFLCRSSTLVELEFGDIGFCGGRKNPHPCSLLKINPQTVSGLALVKLWYSLVFHKLVCCYSMEEHMCLFLFETVGSYFSQPGKSCKRIKIFEHLQLFHKAKYWWGHPWQTLNRTLGKGPFISPAQKLLTTSL